MKRIFHSYDEHVQNVLSGIKFDLESEDAVRVITDYLIRELGTNFPELTRDDVEKFTRDAWEIGQAYEVGVKDIATRINQDALDFFGRLNNADYGKLFNSQRDVFYESIRSVLDGSKTKADAIKALKERLGVDLKNTEITERIEDIFRNKIYTSQNFSRIQRMQVLGITEVEVVAIMDAKTSPICRELNGRKFQVSEMNDFVEEFISKPVDENFWDSYRQPTAQDLKEFPSMSSSDVLKKMNVKAPPFHFRCRTTIVMFTKSVVNRITNQGEKTVLEGNVEQPLKADKRRTANNKEREHNLSGLEPDELLNKIAAIQGNVAWNTENLKSHWQKRIGDGDDTIFGKTEASYASKALDVVKNFSMLYTYIHESKAGIRTHKFGFVQSHKSGEKFFVPVNANTFEIDSLFLIDRDGYTDSYLRIL
ncbi:phage protein F-like protein [Leptospira santarosai str. CBC1531]|uniref:phage minor head protein n=1 Tax=Leptospira santarosai TaxID=28183 RepID=UPI0002BEBD04|nr:phage minor head protein [Leptospira santarosai]EMP80039.1 phage protein F-like protein [Leptospira santarosai str. CBC1531]